ncbi:MAG: hypothetical protein ABSE56_14485 [Bryobacteraceae bacterium]|jgi:hypothetical protein
MKLQPSYLNATLGKRFFNFAVDSAHAEDYLAIYNFVRSSGSRPSILLIGLDVEALHGDDSFDDRLLNTPELLSHLPVDVTESPAILRPLRRLKEVFSIQYTLDILRSLQHATQTHPALQTSFDPDGYLHYPAWESEKQSGRFALETHIRASCPEYLRRFQTMRSISPKRKQYLEILLAQASKDGVATILWISPIHPDVVQYITSKTEYLARLLEVRRFLMLLAPRYRIAVRDFSDPAYFNALPAGWYDGGHMDEVNTKLMTDGLLISLDAH